jgi:uncharacterized lipoprotein YddW (UPF0748 family)
LFVFVLLLLWVPSARADEVRALWVVRTTLASAEAIDAMVEAARDGGFNTLLVQVRGRGDAYFSGGVEPRAAPLAGQPSFDPLAHTITRARAAGLRVHAWVNVNLVAGLGDLPAPADHIVSSHPEWLMVPRPLAETLAQVEPSDPEYLRHLTEYVATRQDEVEGLYLSPLPDGSAEYTTGVIADLAARYPLDGIHLDYARYPGDIFDYSRSAMETFRAAVVEDLSPDERRQLDTRMQTRPTIYADMFPERWARFRRDRLTQLVVRIRDAVEAARPAALLSAAVFPDAGDATERRFQDWPGWMLYGVLDVICPMAYTTDAVVFSRQMTAVRRLAGPERVWSGIGAYRLSPGEIVERVRLARSLQVGGVVLFSYDTLAEAPAGSARVVTVGRAAFE